MPLDTKRHLVRKLVMTRAHRREIPGLITPTHANGPKMMHMKPPLTRAPNAVGPHVRASPTIARKHRMFLLRGERGAVLRSSV